MLVKFKQLVIDNQGYQRKIFFEDIFLNPNSIVSIMNYDGATEFLISESSEYAKEEFSLIRVSYGPKVEEVIVSGTATSLSEKIQSSQRARRVLHG